MLTKPELDPKRGMPCSLICALIPGGLLFLVVVMMLGGWAAEDEPAPTTSAQKQADEISE